MVWTWWTLQKNWDQQWISWYTGKLAWSIFSKYYIFKKLSFLCNDVRSVVIDQTSKAQKLFRDSNYNFTYAGSIIYALLLNLRTNCDQVIQRSWNKGLRRGRFGWKSADMCQHAYCIGMHTVSACILRRHAYCVSMHTVSACILRRHAYCVRMHTVSACRLCQHAYVCKHWRV